jgi:hypothetical protein
VFGVLATFLHHLRGNTSIDLLIGDDILATAVLLLQQLSITTSLKTFRKGRGVLFVMLTAWLSNVFSEFTPLRSGTTLHVRLHLTTDFSSGVIVIKLLEELFLTALSDLASLEILRGATDRVTTVRNDSIVLTTLLDLTIQEVGGGTDDGLTFTVGMCWEQGTTLVIGSSVSQGRI